MNGRSIQEASFARHGFVARPGRPTREPNSRMILIDPASLPITAAAFVTAVTIAGIVIAAFRIPRAKTSLIRRPASCPVTIIRPIAGLERFSEETLRSAFLLDHPEYEILFCVRSSRDPVVPLVRRLIASHPSVTARLLVGDERVSDNPKLNNCFKGWQAAKHDWVVIADSNVLMPPDYLARLLSAWRADTGLVCSTPVGARPDGFWAEVECAFLNTLQARWQYAAEALGLGFAQGKSMLWHRRFLDAHGGIRSLGAEIAEDAAATKLVRAAGLHVHLVSRPFEQPLGLRSAGEVWARQLRWARLRRVTFPLFFAPEILSTPAVPALLLAGGIGGTAGVSAAAATLAAWYSAEVLLAKRLDWHFSWRMPLAFAARDLLIPALWVAAFVTRNVVWRGNRLHIGIRKPGELAAEPSGA